MIRCIRALLDFTYLARRPSHDAVALQKMEKALSDFHQYRNVFVDVEVRDAEFSLPRQHSLVHYVRSIKLFGSPNGLCSSITENKHIYAVKRPWRATNRYNPLDQILLINTRLFKISSARADFGRRGMLKGDVLTGAALPAIFEEEEDGGNGADDDELADDGEESPDTIVELARKPGTFTWGFLLSVYPSYMLTPLLAYMQDIDSLSQELGELGIRDMVSRFLFDQIFGDTLGYSSDQADPDDLPRFAGRFSVYKSASVLFYAPSELAGPSGMHREMIRSTSRWYNSYERRDTVLIQLGDEDVDPLGGMVVARVLRFISFVHDEIFYPCALVNWYLPEDNEPDEVSGMWVVKPEKENGRRTIGLVHLDSIVRACHLMPVFGETRIPTYFHFSNTLSAFKAFYLNHYIDFHAREYIPTT